jgi:hypothetical protein
MFILAFAMAAFVVQFRVGEEDRLKENVKLLKIGMSSFDTENLLGMPLRKQMDDWYYQFDDKSYLKVSFYNKRIRSAILTFQEPVPYVDYPFPSSKEYVEMKVERAPASESAQAVVVAIPEEGKSWRILTNGSVKSVTWQLPFRSSSPKKSLESILVEVQGMKKTAKK